MRKKPERLLVAADAIFGTPVRRPYTSLSQIFLFSGWWNRRRITTYRTYMVYLACIHRLVMQLMSVKVTVNVCPGTRNNIIISSLIIHTRTVVSFRNLILGQMEKWEPYFRIVADPWIHQVRSKGGEAWPIH
jgi:hypothetical protein